MKGDTAAVVLQGAAAAFDKPYTYIIPPDMSRTALPGCRVLVPFGKGNRKCQGMIISRSVSELKGLKSLLSLIDKTPILSEEMLSLCGYLKESTFCTYYDAIHTVLPAGLTCRLVNYYSHNDEFADMSLLGDCEKHIYLYLKSGGEKSESDIKKNFGDVSDLLEKMVENQALIKNSDAKRRMNDTVQKWVSLSEDADLENEKFTQRQREVVGILKEIGSASVKEICYFTGVSTAVVDGLVRRGTLIRYEKQVYRTVTAARKGNRTEIKLTDEQQAAFDGLINDYENALPKTALLYGVTGAGKTQVFLKLVDRAVDDGRGVIVTVPEIALTPQLLSLFSNRYGDKTAVFHSAMSIGQRMDEWKRIRDKKALIAIGTRSAVFAPFSDVGLIIIDEEQEHTYKSERAPRFHARDVAKFRIAASGGLLCLASATPSVESYTLAENRKYSLYTIKHRYGNAVLPDVETVDMKQEIRSGNTGALSNRLFEEVRDALENGHQAILLLNRRGHNTYISCPDCGGTAVCPNCSISLTYHSANHRLMCHYCGYSVPASRKCPDCGNEHMRFMGIGTQKAEEEIKTLFPEASVLRLDADSTVSRDSFAKYLSDFSEGKYDILLGTQMVAKGLDFPNVTVVGVLGADSAAYSEDFRSFERSFSLLTQVAGRAGRGNSPGKAIIQTINPDSNIITLAARQDYEGFYNEEILNRKLMIYPPYCDICLVMTRSSVRELAEEAINAVFGNIKSSIENEYSDIRLIILGPSPASVVKVRNQYRYRMIIKCKANKKFREMLRKAVAVNLKRDTSLSVDIDPENII